MSSSLLRSNAGASELKRRGKAENQGVYPCAGKGKKEKKRGRLDRRQRARRNKDASITVALLQKEKRGGRLGLFGLAVERRHVGFSDKKRKRMSFLGECPYEGGRRPFPAQGEKKGEGRGLQKVAIS